MSVAVLLDLIVALTLAGAVLGRRRLIVEGDRRGSVTFTITVDTTAFMAASQRAMAAIHEYEMGMARIKAAAGVSTSELTRITADIRALAATQHPTEGDRP